MKKISVRKYTPVSTQRCFDVETTLPGRQQICYKVETTLCAYWEI